MCTEESIAGGRREVIRDSGLSQTCKCEHEEYKSPFQEASLGSPLLAGQPLPFLLSFAVSGLSLCCLLTALF